VNLLRRRSLPCIGGFAELAWAWSKKVRQFAGYGFDWVRRGALNYGLPPNRYMNQVLYTTVMYQLTRQLSLGAEVSYFITNYLGQDDGDSLHLQLSAIYKF